MPSFDDMRARLAAANPDALLADGLESALVGHVQIYPGPIVALYDRRLCIEAMTGLGLTHDQAAEYLEFNTFGAYVGDNTPAFCVLWRASDDRRAKP